MNAPEFLPLDDDAWPESIRSMRDGFAGGLNVYRVMAHHPALLRAWAEYRDHVVVKTTLGARRSEVVILRTGHRFGADYEWSHHVSRGRACGMSDARIASIAGSTASMAPEDALIAGAVDELVDDRRLSTATLARLVALVGKEGVFDIIATVGFYSTLGYLVKSFETPLDDNILRELAERPLAP